MAGQTITLTIEKLAGLGDGAGVFEGKKVFVPYTLAGDVVRAKIVRETSEGDWGALTEVLTPGPGRNAPVCRHFSVCGGCALQHLQPPSYHSFKQKMAEEAVRKAGFDPAVVSPLIAIPAASRRRAEFKIEDGKLGFYEERSHALVDIAECPVLDPALFALVMRMKERLIPLSRASLQINEVDGGYDAVLDAGAQTPPDFSDISELLRLSSREGKKLRTVFTRGPVTLKLGAVSVEVPPGAFLQATKEAQERMTALVAQGVGEATRVYDLFSGLGTFSFPLLPGKQITAVESDASMVRAMQDAAARHKPGKSFRAERRDLFANPVPAASLAGCDAVIINPPRPGAKAQCEELARSGVRAILMVSCNPATFSRDARVLKDGGHALSRLTPIDQFVYSPYLELVAEFHK